MRFCLVYCFLFFAWNSFSQCQLFGIVVSDKDGNPVSRSITTVTSITGSLKFEIHGDEFGRFSLDSIPCGAYDLIIVADNHVAYDTSFFVDSEMQELKITMRYTKTLGPIIINHESDFTYEKMTIIDGATLTHSKKTHEIDMARIGGNTGSNNARELYASVPGLNIWESDGGGLQLGIGARGLSPNRTEHFNTRQNGYDISADALGYPESYYTPPAEAIQSVQFIRGASSLQFGPQFGGMINFKLRPASTKTFEYRGTHTYGAYNLVNTFNSFSGTINHRFSYLAYYSYKMSDGWRANSAFDQHNAFAQLKYSFTEKMFLSVEYTYMSYLAQQAGGLTDALFDMDPRQSIRSRNWFKVDWRILSANYNWKINRRTLLDLKFFKVDASRLALGNLDKISRLDDMEERDLIDGRFSNFGIELRMLQHYPVGKKMRGSIVYGGRFYQGRTINKQGLADSTSLPHFTFLNPTDLEGSNYEFPSQNIAGYFENLIQLNSRFWISAGFRYEYINTGATGHYREMVFHPLTEELIYDTTYTEDKSHQRSIYLGGIGFTWHAFEDAEFYGNIAQNYRGINFSDIRVLNPNIQVDPEIQDEKGFNADFGIRAAMRKLTYDVSGFFLYYDNKIGLIDKKLSEYEFIRFRTNVGNAYSTGIECYAEYKFKPLKYKTPEHYFSAFTNLALVYARYGDYSSNAYAGNWVELVPPVTGKLGVRYHSRSWQYSLLATYVHKQFSDATNATFDPDAVAGIIPTYYVLDFMASYKINTKLNLKAGVNNLTNNHYFTRRATGYPGPGIIPSDGISFYLTISVVL